MPGLIDTGFAQWLRAPALYTNAPNNGLAAGLLGQAVESEIISPLLTKAAADSEAGRQMAVLGGPLAVDQHIIKGQRVDLVGKPITLTGPQLGYEAGATVFVIEADELEANLTAILVLRKLV
jgi:hypothetical protein